MVGRREKWHTPAKGMRKSSSLKFLGPAVIHRAVMRMAMVTMAMLRRVKASMVKSSPAMVAVWTSVRASLSDHRRANGGKDRGELKVLNFGYKSSFITGWCAARKPGARKKIDVSISIQGRGGKGRRIKIKSRLITTWSDRLGLNDR